MTIYHKHHIIPKHMGGTDEPDNLVELTIEEHAEAHRKLYEEHGKQEDYLAWKGLLGLIDKDEMILALNRLPSRRKKISEWNKGRKKSKEHRKNISEARKMIIGWNHSDETKKKMSKIAKIHNPGFTKQFECPKCGKSGQIANMIRHHGKKGEKCKWYRE